MSAYPGPRISVDTKKPEIVATMPFTGKRAFDLIVALALSPLLLVVAVLLVLTNPFLNVGPLIFVQERMGWDCRPFLAFKFRTMSAIDNGERTAFDRLEEDRISRFAGLLRRTRIDELPQIVNVLRGEMSMIGPRPDAMSHARIYVREVPRYADRYRVRPGISGYAQTEVGYVDGMAALQRKVAADIYYLEHASFRFDLWIAWRTLGVIFARRGR